MLLWPQPLQSVEGSPWKAAIGSEKVRPSLWTRIVASVLAMDQSPRGRVSVGEFA